jgi:hypothetical protein
MINPHKAHFPHHTNCLFCLAKYDHTCASSAAFVRRQRYATHPRIIALMQLRGRRANYHGQQQQQEKMSRCRTASIPPLLCVHPSFSRGRHRRASWTNTFFNSGKFAFDGTDRVRFFVLSTFYQNVYLLLCTNIFIWGSIERKKENLIGWRSIYLHHMGC